MTEHAQARVFWETFKGIREYWHPKQRLYHPLQIVCFAAIRGRSRMVAPHIRNCTAGASSEAFLP